MESKLNDYLSDLVSINSINPDLSSEGQGEYEIAQYVASHFKKIGIDYNLDEVINDRYNVSALLNGQDRNKIFFLIISLIIFLENVATFLLSIFSELSNFFSISGQIF